MFTLSSVTTTTGHTVKIAKNRCRLDSRRHFFSERVIDRWNRLPQHVTDSASLIRLQICTGQTEISIDRLVAKLVWWDLERGLSTFLL